MRLPPLCRFFRGGVLFGLILFLGVLLEPRVLIWGPFWVSVSGLGVQGCRQQLQDAKIAPLCSARPVLPKRLPPSVLAVRRDLHGLQCPKSLNKHANHDGQRAQTGETFWPKRAWLLERGAILEGLQNAKHHWYLAFLGPSKT